MEVKEMLAHPSNFTKGRKQKIQYIVVHYTANNGDTAEGNGKYFSGADRNTSAHYFVDEIKIVRSVFDKDTAWHCGAKIYRHKKCRNENSIGVEMCSKKDSNGQYYINQKTQNNAAELVKWLMKKYDIPIENVLRHYDVTGKLCPEPFAKNQKLWLDFKQKLLQSKEVKKEMLYNYIDENMPAWARPTIQKLVDKGALQGNEKGEFLLTDVMLRIFVAIDRSGAYDK